MLSFYNIQSLGDSVNVIIDLNNLGITLGKKDKVTIYDYFRKHVGYILCKDNILLYGNDIQLFN